MLSMITRNAKEGGRGEKTTWSQRSAMLAWLEAPPGSNFQLITGQAQSTMRGVVAGTKLTKEAAYDRLADYVNDACNVSWTAKNAKARFSNYLKIYKETKRRYNDPTGGKFTLNETDFAKGIYSIEDKIESECPAYTRMDKLFGDRQNVVPSSVFQSTDLVMDDIAYDDDDKDSQSSGDEEGKQESPESVIVSSTVSVTATENETTVSSNQSSVQEQLEKPDDSKSSEKRKIQEDPSMWLSNSRTKKTKDLNSIFFESKERTLQLQKEKFEWEKESKNEEMKIKRVEIQEETRRQIILKLIEQGKTAEEIEEYVNMLAHL